MDRVVEVIQTKDTIKILVDKKGLLDYYKFNDQLPEIKILDENQFFSDLIDALSCEEEDGATPCTVLLDRALESCLENGVESIEEIEEE